MKRCQMNRRCGLAKRGEGGTGEKTKEGETSTIRGEAQHSTKEKGEGRRVFRRKKAWRRENPGFSIRTAAVGLRTKQQESEGVSGETRNVVSILYTMKEEDGGAGMKEFSSRS